MRITENSVTINLKSWKSTNLSIQEYVFLKLLVEKGYTFADNTIKLTEAELSKLQLEGYIEVIDTPEAVLSLPTQKSTKLFIEADNKFEKYFEELYKAYPRKVVDKSGGIRILRAENLTSQDAEKCKKRYLMFLQDHPNDHTKVMEGLKTELRTRGVNNLGYMQNLETWIHQRTWEKYQDLGDSSQSESNERFKRI